MTQSALGLNGYDVADRYYATRFTQGRRTVYSVDLSLDIAACTLPRPDPSRPTPGNRRVNERHARAFGAYVREHADWIAPALLLRSSAPFEFRSERQIAGTQFGVLSLPRFSRNSLRILDGQHRILGLQLAIEEVGADLERKRSLAAMARRDGNSAAERVHQREAQKLEEQLQRFSRERIAIQIYVEADQGAYTQMFVDIADNAKGISAAVRSRFDTRKVVNRSLEAVLEHPMLQGRVDIENDRIGASGPYLLGAKHVADIIRVVTVGIAGHISRRQEHELREDEVVQRSNALLAGFPQLQAVATGCLRPAELRARSLLGSATMLRILAGVYFELSSNSSDGEIVRFFAKLDRFMGAPVRPGSIWSTLAEGAITDGAVAPSARRQDVVALTRRMTGWAKLPPSWLAAGSQSA